MTKPTRTLYLDLDGTVRLGYDELGRFVNKPEDVQIFEGVPELIRMYKEAGWRIVGITNQGGVALGHLTLADLKENIAQTNHLCGGLFDNIVACCHHPDAKDPEMAVCWCRKPRIGNIVMSAELMGRAFQEYYPPHLALFVGDRDEDKQCAENAGISFEWAKDWRMRSEV